jgi:hypothetical protein
MNAEEMKATLTENLKTVGGELAELEKQFTLKREQYIKIQGALEALNELKVD